MTQRLGLCSLRQRAEKPAFPAEFLLLDDPHSSHPLAQTPAPFFFVVVVQINSTYFASGALSIFPLDECFPSHSAHFTSREAAMDELGCPAPRRSPAEFSIPQLHLGLTWQSHPHFTPHFHTYFTLRNTGANNRTAGMQSRFKNKNQYFQSSGKELK